MGSDPLTAFSIVLDTILDCISTLRPTRAAPVVRGCLRGRLRGARLGRHCEPGHLDGRLCVGCRLESWSVDGCVVDGCPRDGCFADGCFADSCLPDSCRCPVTTCPSCASPACDQVLPAHSSALPPGPVSPSAALQPRCGGRLPQREALAARRPEHPIPPSATPHTSRLRLPGTLPPGPGQVPDPGPSGVEPLRLPSIPASLPSSPGFSPLRTCLPDKPHRAGVPSRPASRLSCRKSSAPAWRRWPIATRAPSATWPGC